jgi:hypothetical protein
MGDLDGIAKRTTELDEKFASFAHKLRHLATDFEDEMVISLLEEYM